MKQTLSEIYNTLITESVNRNELIKAMDEKRLVTIYYDSPHGTIAKGWRRIEPFCYGINHSDNTVLRAWQVHGVSDTPLGRADDPLTEIPGWRMFRIDGIKSINYTGNDRFTQPRPKYNPQDSDMKIIYKAVDFGGTLGGTQPTTSPEPTKPLFSTNPAPKPEPQVEPQSASLAPSLADRPSPSKPVATPDRRPEPVTTNQTQTQKPSPFTSTPSAEDERLKDKPEWLQTFLDKFKRIINYNGKK